MNSEDQKEITIEELLTRITNAQDGMGPHNPNKILLEQCRIAIIHLVQRIPDEQLAARPRVTLR